MVDKNITVNWSSFYKKNEFKSDEIPNEKGVYEYCLDSKDIERIYIGVGEIRDRHNIHISNFEKNPCLKKNLAQYNWLFRYDIIENENDRLDAELGLYKKHKHKCNKSVPPGSGLGDRAVHEVTR